MEGGKEGRERERYGGRERERDGGRGEGREKERARWRETEKERWDREATLVRLSKTPEIENMLCISTGNR